MPNTFNVVSLGVILDPFGNPIIIDPIEGSGNTVAENAALLEGLQFGGPDGDYLAGQSILDNFAVLTQGQPGFNSGLNGIYDQDNDPNEYFRIDGGEERIFDAVATYNATITYTDGTPPATITAVIFQDTLGNTFWAPEITSNADQIAMEQAPIATLTLGTLVNNDSDGLAGNREAWAFAPCFVKGTNILTPLGQRRIEELRVGDTVVTRDNGVQKIVWIGSATHKSEGKLSPVRITAGALGNDFPVHDLLVSRQHRMVVESPICKRMFGEDEVFVPAIKLTALPGIFVDETLSDVTYIHFKTRQHDVVFAEGAPSETLLSGKFAYEALSPDAISELNIIFPELRNCDEKAARVKVDGKRAKQLLARHLKNATPCVPEPDTTVIH